MAEQLGTAVLDIEAKVSPIIVVPFTSLAVGLLAVFVNGKIERVRLIAGRINRGE